MLLPVTVPLRAAGRPVNLLERLAHDLFGVRQYHPVLQVLELVLLPPLHVVVIDLGIVRFCSRCQFLLRGLALAIRLRRAF